MKGLARSLPVSTPRAPRAPTILEETATDHGPRPRVPTSSALGRPRDSFRPLSMPPAGAPTISNLQCPTLALRNHPQLARVFLHRPTGKRTSPSRLILMEERDLHQSVCHLRAHQHLRVAFLDLTVLSRRNLQRPAVCTPIWTPTPSHDHQRHPATTPHHRPPSNRSTATNNPTLRPPLLLRRLRRAPGEDLLRSSTLPRWHPLVLTATPVIMFHLWEDRSCPTLLPLGTRCHS